jgi:hypothetical protein
MAALAWTKPVAPQELPGLTQSLMAIAKAGHSKYHHVVDPKKVLARIKEAAAVVRKEPTLVEVGQPEQAVRSCAATRSRGSCLPLRRHASPPDDVRRCAAALRSSPLARLPRRCSW